jgi:hypothetical protein
MANDMIADKEQACKEIASTIKTLCDRHNVAPLSLGLGKRPDYGNGGTQWDGNVHLTIGC